ncbi:hypothetical protein ACXYMX_01295 [Sporosarcina sp. CAU 1771]
MKIRFIFSLTLLSILLLLAACGTSESVDEKNNEDTIEESTNSSETIDDKNDSVKETEGETPNETTNDKESGSSEVNNPSDKEETLTANRTETIVLTYNDGENVKEKEAELTKSDEQDYSMYVLPTYELTSEEPGRDSLLFGDGTVFMRIETMVAEEGTHAFALENIHATLEASSANGVIEEITDASLLPSNEEITHAKGFSLKLDTVTLSGLVFERDGIVVKLTIFDTPEREHYDAFLQMANTIMKD